MADIAKIGFPAYQCKAAPPASPFGFGVTLVPETALDGEVIARNEALGEFLFWSHEYVAYIVLIALALHIAGALKHHFIDKDNTPRRMIKGN